jgi:hypothetical protein
MSWRLPAREWYRVFASPLEQTGSRAAGPQGGRVDAFGGGSVGGAQVHT